MKKTFLLFLIIVAVGIAVELADAQQPSKMPRIIFLCTMSGHSFHTEAFGQGLRELGYIEGKNIAIEYRFTEGKSDRIRDLAAEMGRMKLDVIVTHGSPSIRAAQQATSRIPIVMAISEDPVGQGFVASLARPGGNITGLSILATELSGKRLELLKEAVPRVTRVAVLWNPANPGDLHSLREIEGASAVLGVQLQTLDVRGPNEISNAFGAATAGRSGALLVLPDPMFHSQHKRIAELARKSRLPTISDDMDFVRVGGLMAYGASLSDMFRRSAIYVDKILKGATPGDLPVEQPTKFELVINLKTAKAIGLTVPPEMLMRADNVIR